MDLFEDRVWVILRLSVGMMYGAGYMRCGCLTEAKSTAHQRKAEKSGRGSYLEIRKAGRNEQSIIPPR